MTNTWLLPKTAQIGGVEYSINADFRDVLEVIEYLTDVNRPEFIRWQIAISLFFKEDIPKEHQKEAMEYMAKFISYGEDRENTGPKLYDWTQDAQLIVGDVNKVAGTEVRALPFLHWWTFLTYFYGIGEGRLSTVVTIRKKKANHKKLEKWEQEFYYANRSLVDLKPTESEEEKKIKEGLIRWLDGGKR